VKPARAPADEQGAGMVANLSLDKMDVRVYRNPLSQDSDERTQGTPAIYSTVHGEPQNRDFSRSLSLEKKA